jgi:general secretion pathway protein H
LINSHAASERGFTLIELMVVVLIIGIVVASTVLAIGATGKDRPLEQERDRIVAMTQYVRERGELQIREYGLRLSPNDYQFVVYEPRTHQWQVDDLDHTLRRRKLPEGLGFTLVVEGREVILEATKPQGQLKDRAEDLTPQVMLFSNGDTSDFELTLARAEAARSVTLKSAGDGEISVGALEDQRK